MKSFTDQIFGAGDIGLLFAALLYAYVGGFVCILWEITHRDIKSMRTPEELSWAFWWKDNRWRVLLSVILIFIAVRFSQELLGKQITVWGGLLIGLGFDKLSELLRNALSLGQKSS